ncbi:MAG TPA: diguanylate cyclase [Janthinobacterium sp.]|nr:diguanylate cyclase [Janthinobacterium sp.]
MLKRPSITSRATLFVAVVCVSLLVSDGWRSWNARTVHLQEVESATRNLARAMAQQADDTIKSADIVLGDMVGLIDIDNNDAAVLRRLHQALAARAAELPQLEGLFVYDENGRWVVNSRSAEVKSLNNSDRDYFIFHRQHPGHASYVGMPIKSRSSGKWIVTVSRRISRVDGSFAGVVTATIGIDYFSRFYQSLDIGQDGAVALLSNSGIIMFRRPSGGMGKDFSASPLYHAYQARPVGTAILRSGQDNVVRLNSYRPLEHYPLFVTAALSRDEALEYWRRDTFLHSLGVLLLTLLLGFFGLRLVRQIELRAKAEHELTVARDALESLNRDLEKLAMQDGLTGLANRRQLDATLDAEFSRAMRAGAPLAFIMIDVDHFKQYNDRYGHANGDECLRAVSLAIRRLTPSRPGDLAARYGGEEIGVLLPGTGLDGALAVAEMICKAIADTGIVHAGSSFGIVTVSAGVAALVPQRDRHQPGDLVEAADKALYAAKAGGRNRVHGGAMEVV